jgi:hypothetical protein|nr:hypothetical protein [Caldivirga sp. MU80]
MNHRLRRDGIVRYPQYTHGGFASFILAWAYFLSAVTVAPSEAIAAVTHMSTWLPQLTVSGVLTPLGVVVATREVRQKLSKLREGRRKWDILRKTAKAIEELAKREQCSCGCWEDYWEC